MISKRSKIERRTYDRIPRRMKISVAIVAIAIATLAVVAVALVSSRSARARDITINEQQQQTVFVICERAARSPAPTTSLEEIVSIANFCIGWRNMMQSPAPDAPKAASPPN